MSEENDPSPKFEPLSAADRDTSRRHPLGHRTRSSTSIIAIWLLTVVLIAVVAFVIFILPEQFETATDTADESTETEVAAAVTTDTSGDDSSEDEPLVPLSPEVQSERRNRAQAVLQEVLELRDQLTAQRIELWAKDEFDSAVARIPDGETDYREQRYARAIDTFAAIKTELAELNERVPFVVENALTEGRAALDDGNSKLAATAFELATHIDPENEAAQQGLARAATLDEVLALLAEAQGFEDLKDNAAARERYEQALKLDPATTSATNALARLDAAALDARFRKQMSAGYAALEKERLDEALKGFRAAQKLKPKDDDAATAIAQTKNRLDQRNINKHLGAAEKAVSREAWLDAAAAFAQALKIDSKLGEARDKERIARARAKLDRQLEQAIGERKRLHEDSVHAEAEQVLKRARGITNPGARLRAQIKRLADAIEYARTPVAVTLISDTLSEVTVYKVGRIGAFDRHALELLPGRYVAVANRDGYRDQRVVFDVVPQQSPLVVHVRCDEPVSFGR